MQQFNSKTMVRVISLMFMFGLVALLAACSRPDRSGFPGDSSDRPLATPALPEIEASGEIEVPEAAQRQVDPLPDFDPVSALVTQAYQSVEVEHDEESAAATATAIADPLGSSGEDVNGVNGGGGGGSGGPYISPLLSTPTAFAPAPPLVIMPSSVQVPHGVNKAICVIANVGDCQPTMADGQDLYFTWTFGIEGSEQLRYGQALVVVTRDGQHYRTIWTSNTVDPNPPDPEDKVMSVINVGQQAIFQAGLEDVPAGYYTAILRMCLMEVSDCEDGRGWTNVGGDTINFLIVED